MLLCSPMVAAMLAHGRLMRNWEYSGPNGQTNCKERTEPHFSLIIHKATNVNVKCLEKKGVPND